MSGGEGKQREKDPVKPTTTVKTEGVVAKGRKVHCLSGAKTEGAKITVNDVAGGKKVFNQLCELGLIK